MIRLVLEKGVDMYFVTFEEQDVNLHSIEYHQTYQEFENLTQAKVFLEQLYEVGSARDIRVWEAIGVDYSVSIVATVKINED